VLRGPLLPFDPPGANFVAHRTPRVLGPDVYFVTANIFYRRSVFEEVGGFDERYRVTRTGRPVYGEDVELGWRVTRLGYPTGFSSELPVHHSNTPQSLLDWFREATRAQGFPSLVARVPELRDSDKMYRRYFWKVTLPFYPLAAGVIGAAITRRPAVALLGALPWLARTSHAWQAQSPRRMVLSPVRFGLMTANLGLTVACLWYGSLRSRTLVL
jgi:hypothetical protein